MRVFKHPNLEGFKCPICGTSKDGEIVLVGIQGTQEGYNMEAEQIHLNCLELTLDKERQLVYQVYGKHFNLT